MSLFGLKVVSRSGQGVLGWIVRAVRDRVDPRTVWEPLNRLGLYPDPFESFEIDYTNIFRLERSGRALRLVPRDRPFYRGALAESVEVREGYYRIVFRARGFNVRTGEEMIRYRTFEFPEYLTRGEVESQVVELMEKQITDFAVEVIYGEYGIRWAY